MRSIPKNRVMRRAPGARRPGNPLPNVGAPLPTPGALLPHLGTAMDTDATRTPRRRHRLTGYSLVLLLIAVSYVLCAAQVTTDPTASAFLVQLITVAVILHVAEVNATLRRAGWVVLAVAGVASVTVQIAGARGHLLDIVLSTASALAYAIAPVAVIAHQVQRRRVDAQSLLAAIAAYVMVGMFFTFLYNVASLVTGVPTFGQGADDSLTSQLFFSFTTLTTTGYGNLVPVSALGQTVAIAEAIAGQLFLVIAVARIVAGWERPDAQR